LVLAFSGQFQENLFIHAEYVRGRVQFDPIDSEVLFRLVQIDARPDVDNATRLSVTNPFYLLIGNLVF
jgi:hypothetical protein